MEIKFLFGLLHIQAKTHGELNKVTWRDLEQYIDT